MKRREAREIAFCLIFEKDFAKDTPISEIYANAINYFEDSDIESEPYILSTFKGVFDNVDDIDAHILKSSDNWDPSRISRVSKAILRLAIYELKYSDDIPVRIAVNEAVEIAKKYDEEKAFSYVNGVLAKVVKELGKTDD